MEKTAAVRRNILDLLTQHFGGTTRKTFEDFYADETLPIFIDASAKVLADLTGWPKAIEELNHILRQYKMKEISNE